MLQTFNCGVGLIAVADTARAVDVVAAFQEHGEHAFAIGTLIPGVGSEAQVHYRGGFA
jgi:phosphoribosylaminoimidazole (AIR) synthetase